MAEFKRMNIPTISDINALDRMGKGINVHMLGVTPGVPCIIMNGLVCNINGIPYGNKSFQEDFKDIADRMEACKCVAFGNLIDTCGGSSSSYSFVEHLGAESRWYDKNRNEIVIELNDILNMAGKSIKFSTRFQLMANLVRSIKYLNKDLPINIVKNQVLESYNKDDALLFFNDNLSEGLTTQVRQSESAYAEDGSTVAECNCYYLDPYKVYELEIDSFTECDGYDPVAEDNMPMVSSITVLRGKEKIKIDIDTNNAAHATYLKVLLRKDLLMKFTFLAVEIAGKLKYCKQLCN